MLSKTIPIYLLPGMTRDYPVFSRLVPYLPGSTVVSYIEPYPNESIVAYARRMTDRLPKECYLAGVSFGGIVAQEVSRLLEPRGCIVISSVLHPRELPPLFRILRLLSRRSCQTALSLTGTLAFSFPTMLRSRSTMRLTKLAGAAGAWHRWATASVLEWTACGDAISAPLLHIHGDADTTFPIRYTKPDVIVPGGLHALPISHPAETARAIHNFISSR